MLKIKEALEKLNSACKLFQDGVARVEEKDKSQSQAQAKIDEETQANKDTAKDLETRGASIAHIEDADKTYKEGTDLLKEARQEKADLQVAIEKHEANKKEDAQKQKIAWDEIESARVVDKKQAEAIQKERKILDEGKRKFALEQRLSKEK